MKEFDLFDSPAQPATGESKPAPVAPALPVDLWGEMPERVNEAPTVREAVNPLRLPVVRLPRLSRGVLGGLAGIVVLGGAAWWWNSNVASRASRDMPRHAPTVQNASQVATPIPSTPRPVAHMRSRSGVVEAIPDMPNLATPLRDEQEHAAPIRGNEDPAAEMRNLSWQPVPTRATPQPVAIVRDEPRPLSTARNHSTQSPASRATPQEPTARRANPNSATASRDTSALDAQVRQMEQWYEERRKKGG